MRQNPRIAIESWLNLFALDLLIFSVVVLVIYMAITPITEFLPVQVDLPESSAALNSPGFEHEVTVSVRRDAIFLGPTVVDIAALDRRLASGPLDRATLRVRAARDVPYRAVRRIVRSAQQAGFQRVTFVVRRALRGAPDFMALYGCPPNVNQIRIGVLLALLAFGGAVVASLRTHRPGCIGWLLLLTAVVAVCVAWDGFRPPCLWY